MHAILETAINSDLPGSLRAIIDQPVMQKMVRKCLYHQAVV